jgi:hypothetical protein
MNGFDGTRESTGENTLSCTGGFTEGCTTFCEVPGAIGFGICAGIGVSLGNWGVISSVGSAGAPGIAVLGAMDVGAGGGVVVVFVMDAVARGLPHRGQNEACRSSSALQRGQRKVGAGGDEGCAGDGGEVADISRGAWSVVDCAFCIASKSSGKSGCVLCWSTGREDPVVGSVEAGNAASTFFRSLLKSATDGYRSLGFIAIARLIIVLR